MSKPSPEAVRIDRAHKRVRLAMGTPREADALKHLADVVAAVRRGAESRRSRMYPCEFCGSVRGPVPLGAAVHPLCDCENATLARDARDREAGDSFRVK